MSHLRQYLYNKKRKNRYLHGNVYTDITITTLMQTQALTDNKNVIERAA